LSEIWSFIQRFGLRVAVAVAVAGVAVGYGVAVAGWQWAERSGEVIPSILSGRGILGVEY
jgi:hypothetical protein